MSRANLTVPFKLLKMDGLNLSSKIVYSLLVHRTKMLLNSGHYLYDPKKHHFYIFYPIKNIASDLNIGYSTARRSLALLDKVNFINKYRIADYTELELVGFHINTHGLTNVHDYLKYFYCFGNFTHTTLLKAIINKENLLCEGREARMIQF